MKIEEAIVFSLAYSGHGMTTDQLAEYINTRKLHLRKDGNPVTNKQVYAVICRHPDLFCKDGGRICLIM